MIVCFLYLTVHELSLKLSKNFMIICADRPLIRIALLLVRPSVVLDERNMRAFVVVYLYC